MQVRCLIAIGTMASLAAAGCDHRDTPRTTQAGSVPMTSVPTTPRQTAERLNKLRSLHQYAELRPYVERAHAAGLTDFLLAMDELMAANDDVQAVIRKYAPTVPAMEWDLSAIENRQGLFSTNVRVIDEHIEGPQAWVTIQVADTVPLEIVPMRRIEGGWVYWPESEVGGLPDAVRRLSRALRRVGRTISHESLTEEEIRTEFRIRISPYLRAIQSIASSQAPTTQPTIVSK